jgi:hypothetical protein
MREKGDDGRRREKIGGENRRERRRNSESDELKRVKRRRIRGSGNSKRMCDGKETRGDIRRK